MAAKLGKWPKLALDVDHHSWSGNFRFGLGTPLQFQNAENLVDLKFIKVFSYLK